MPCTTTIIVPPRQIALLAAMFCTLLGSLAAAGCEKRESVAVQIDVAKTVDVSNRARSPEAGTRVAASGFTVAAGMDDALRRAINTDEFRALALSKRLSKQDDPGQAKLLDAVAGMCAVSVRGSPAASGPRR